MGVLDTLGDWNDQFKDGADTVLDNETFSVQNTVRGSIGAVSGADASDPDEFAEDSAETFKGINHTIAAPGRMVGDATEGTVVDNKATDTAVWAGEGIYEVMAEDVGAMAYGTATGANVRTNDPEEAHGGYRPGMMDAGELLLTVGTGGTGKAVSGAGKSAIKAGPDAAKATTKAASNSDMGILSKLVGGASDAVRGSDEAATVGRTAPTRTVDDAAGQGAKAADETAETTKEIAPEFLRNPSRIGEDLKVPDSLQGTVSGAIDTAKRYPKTTAAAGTGTAFAAIASMGDLPNNYSVVERFDGGEAEVIEQSDGDGVILGYWLSIGESGSTRTILGTDGLSTMSVSFPTSSTPPFDSVSQARNAYQTFLREVKNQQTPAPNDDSSNDDSQPTGWGEATVLKPLQQGWYLVEQGHTQEDKYRYLVTGKDSSGELLYIGPSGSVRNDPQTFGSVDKATAAYQNWLDAAQNGGNTRSPDPGQDRPRSEDINKDQNSGGSLGQIGGIAVAAGAIGAVALLLYKVILA